MLTAARIFAERGVKTAGPDLLAVAENHAGARGYVRVMTRLRQQEQAHITMQNVLADAASNLPVIKEQIEKQGIAAVTDAQWRERVRQTRIETARNGMAAVLEEMGVTVNTYFTPEERLAFASFAESKRNGMNAVDLEKFAIPLAESAALAEQESRWRFELMMQRPSAFPNSYASVQPFIDIERHRGRFAELGSKLEQYENGVPPMYGISPLLAAADAYRSAGDEPNELRVLSSVFSVSGLEMTRQQRSFQLLSCAAGAGTRAHCVELAEALRVSKPPTTPSHTGALSYRIPWCRLADKLARRCGIKLTTRWSDSISPSRLRT